ncbi:inactive protein kinase SELMODRAFT_444075 [Ricinus communis]|uniref:Protein kinase domain-containing protein n=1 Tax=Ricinus communis TaxID=3988 RepID=B9RFT6_RICCO|nr:inactive protein kinase SELMODRAFT_444075 [Ricinus communis]EEF50057.1 conserved hypothetical protein [Ricinus communis]|eukprot:XP_025011899.1 inactive protein kinase SELMODRAFT_444075 [Ricinus communis]
MDNKEVIIVALDASKEITDYALQWAVRNVITRAMDSVIILAILPCHGNAPTSASKTNSFISCLLRKWGHGHRQEKKSSSASNDFKRNAVSQDSFRQINDVCVDMMQQLCLIHNKQVHTRIKVVADAELGSVATEAMEVEATWVILDRRLKKESDCCLKQLSCNIVIIDQAVPELLRAVNPLARKRLGQSTDRSDQNKIGMPPRCTSNYKTGTSRSSITFGTESSMSLSSPGKEQFNKISSPCTTKSKSDIPILRLNSKYFHREVEVQSIFSLSPYNCSKNDILSGFNIGDSPRKSSASSLDGKVKSYNSLLKAKSDMENISDLKAIKKVSVPARRSADSPRLFRKSESPNQLPNRKYSTSSLGEEKAASPSSPSISQRTSSIRKAMSLSIKHPPTPPPLCSICKNNAPIFGKAPRKFTYREIEKATDGFSSDNLLADGGYGLVFKGILDDGQVVAVKQHKRLSAQGASEFCSEVEILSCAQHRNLVMLIGYCIEIEWLLIYEFACNGSLDKHLYGNETNKVLAWDNRMKVAVGTARGLRYLHEDCRVGCIVHRDFRPSNILVTHDFEPMVGDFGLARWQADGQRAEETRVIGAFGYLAPEYTQTGLITEKADVYAFGVVLLELLSGIKATDFSRTTGQQFVQEWGCPLLEKKMINEIIDPQLKQNYAENEVQYMMYAASLCISPNPEKRPRMSKVLKILEGDISTDLAYNHGPHAPNYPKQYVNDIYGADNLMTSPHDHSPSSLLMQSMNNMNLSPPKTSLDRNNGMNSTFRTLGPLEEYKTVRGRASLQHESNVSEEYEAYLQGSLAKFVHNFK